MRGERRGGEGRILVFYQKFLGEDTLTASQSKDLVFQEIRSGDGDAGRRAMMRLLDGQAVERLDQSSSRNLYRTEKENHGFCPTAAGPQPTGPHRVALFFFFFFFFSDRLRLGESFFSFCFFTMLTAKLLFCWITWVIPCMANSPAMSPPRCRLLKHSINKADSGHATELFSSRSPCLLTQHGQG